MVRAYLTTLRLKMNHNASSDAESVSFTVRLPRETAERLRELAASESRSVAAELRRAVQAHVERASKDSKPEGDR